MKLWTIQPKSVLDEIRQTGIFRCREELSYNLSKKNDLKKQYHWLMKQMEKKICTKPEGVSYPIWAWHTWNFERRCPDSDSAAFLERKEDKVLLTLDIPEDQVVLTDFEGWQIVMNGTYLSNETDEDKIEEIGEYLFSLDEDVFQKEVENSWHHVFEIEKAETKDFTRGKFVQATFWELKQSYILDTKILPAEK